MNCAFAEPLYKLDERPSWTPMRPRRMDVTDVKFSYIGRFVVVKTKASLRFQELSNKFLLNSVSLPLKAYTMARNRRLGEFKSLLSELPLVSVYFDFMMDDPAYFFRLKLKGDIELIITQYDDDLTAAYVNVMHNDDFVFQNRIKFQDIISAIKHFYDVYPNGK